AKAVGAASADHSYAVASDINGNVFVGGDTSISGSAPFACLTKFSAVGDVLWSYTCTGVGMMDGSSIYAVATDQNGNVFVTGYFSGTMNLGNGTQPITAVGWTDIFVAKFSPDGLCLCCRGFGSAVM